MIQTSSKFTFRAKDKESKARAPITLSYQMPEVADILGDAKSIEYLQGLIKAEFEAAFRDLLSNNEAITAAEQIDTSSITWESIVNTPPAVRKGFGIAKEVWAAFKAHYIEVMPAITGKSTQACENAAKIFADDKLNSYKRAPEMLAKLKQLLGVYSGISGAEEYADCIEFLANKFDAYDQSQDELLDNI